MLAGIYYGAQYGDSVSAITMKIPHASSIVACIDGYQMTLKGKTGLALFTAGVSSFIGGTVAIMVLATLAPALGEVALLFGPADYCALMTLGFVCVSFVTTGSLSLLLSQLGGVSAPSDQTVAILEAIANLWPKGIPPGIRAKERREKIAGWLKDNGRHVPPDDALDRAIQRAMKGAKKT